VPLGKGAGGGRSVWGSLAAHAADFFRYEHSEVREARRQNNRSDDQYESQGASFAA